MRAILRAVLLCALAAAGQGQAEELSALARLDAAASSVVDTPEGGVLVTLEISQPVPYRVFTLDDPPRLFLDFREVDFGPGGARAMDRAERVAGVDWGRYRPGWSRMMATLAGPMPVTSVEQQTGDAGARIVVRLAAADAARFAAAAGAPPSSDWPAFAPARVDAPKRRQTGAEPLVVVLDPGHGGIDPGAEAGDLTEAEVVRAFALELADMLRRAGMRVTLTRETDVFVPLEMRISVARAAGADVFLSLHADALSEGTAVGATVYQLDEEAADTASALLAERHDRADLLAGVDLAGQDDTVAQVLMDLARLETRPRANRLAEALVFAINAKGGKMHKHPIQGAAFSVLKAPDIPSLLLELGFLSSEADRARLVDPVWRVAMQEAILAALQAWAIADAAEARLVRQ